MRFARIDGSVFFGSVDHVQNTFDLFRSKNLDQRHLAIIAKGISFVDLQGGEALVKEAKRRHADGGGLYLIHVKPELRASLEACGCLEKMGAQNYLFETKTEAIKGIYQRLDKSICATCDKRIFTECQAGFGPGKLYP